MRLNSQNLLNLMLRLKEKKDLNIAKMIAEEILSVIRTQSICDSANFYFLNTSLSFLTASSFLISQSEYPELLSLKSFFSLSSLYFRLLEQKDNLYVGDNFDFYLNINPDLKVSGLILFEARRTVNSYLAENNLFDSKEASDRRLNYFNQLLPLPDFLINVESSNCHSCKYFDGQIYGGNYFNCCVHPSGKKNCLDWEANKSISF
ncbi:MAG: hypothetical protein ACFBSE_15620 [Prochloraceae cyanobacterium]